METNQIKKFAQEARTILQRGVRNRLLALGFDASGNIAEKDMPVCGADHVVFMGRVIGDVSFYHKWMSLYERLQDKGVPYVCEEAAYTWFNRLVAIRIMVKNGFADPVLEYQSDALRVPRIVTDARRGVLPQMSEADRALLMELLDDDTKITEQFAVLIVNYCKHHPILSACFGALTDYTELLLPANILAEGGFVNMLNHTAFISDDDYRQSELIGWLYQFYISEKKDEVFASKEKVKAEDIPAATQIFTPNWIVKYMVQNTLGRIYLDNNPYAVDIKGQMPYLVQPDGPASEVSVFRYDDIHALTVADLACGSGHILNEAFDLLYTIYIEEGYNRRRAIEDIFRYNLSGIDLDPRAKQLAMFALLMKACQRDPSFLDAHCLPRVWDMGVAVAVRRLNAKGGVAALLKEFFAGASKQLITEAMDALALMEQADNLGSIMRFELSDTTRTAIALCMEEWKERGTDDEDMRTLLSAFEIVLALTDKYAALVMNPPYMGGGNMNGVLSNYVKKNYEVGKADLFSVFMLVAEERLVENGKYGMINLPSWLFLSTFEKLRINLLENYHIDSLLHMGRGIFGIDWGSVAFVVTKAQDATYGIYFRLHKRNFQHIYYYHIEQLFLKAVADHSFKYNFDLYRDEEGRVSTFILSHDENGLQLYYVANQQNFEKIPGCPIGYWVSEKIFARFAGNLALSAVAKPCVGLQTADNARFLRYWHEVNLEKIGFGMESAEEAKESEKKWFPYNKGGSSRRWYGNQELLVNWENDGEEIKSFKPAVVRNPSYYFKPSIAWSLTSSIGPAFRYFPSGFIFDVNGMSLFTDNLGLISYLNTKLCTCFLSIINPTLASQIGNVAVLPYCHIDSDVETLLAKQNISISKSDWNAHETSWDFQENELIRLSKEQGEGPHRLAGLMDAYQEHWTEQFLQLHANEEELNRQFIEIYGLEDELTPDVPPEEITILQQGELTFN